MGLGQPRGNYPHTKFVISDEFDPRAGQVLYDRLMLVLSLDVFVHVT